MKCKKCGAEIENVRICDYCGSEVELPEEITEDLRYEIAVLQERIDALSSMKMPESMKTKKIALLEKEMNELVGLNQ